MAIWTDSDHRHIRVDPIWEIGVAPRRRSFKIVTRYVPFNRCGNIFPIYQLSMVEILRQIHTCLPNLKILHMHGRESQSGTT